MQWDDYQEAIEDMLDRTSTKPAPWTVIPANQKWHARIAAMKAITDVFSAGIDLKPPPIDPKVRRAALRLLDGRPQKRDS